ncbi:uncharacterized protein MELLADRAFT_84720 [Melampsora larici-populina 98AG31]|uniref:HTH APSES-type domain-containing protein n=1 Tax=Melampsora larici-populina (strain 98AG31 / pathotype 3-4-7) TaxID=747676 RepID=F4RGM1_MELLP|nr:uncharacterized protein MELLADRAFT_84720 [Melampsora larici-populina 98AG31]EGG08528.1 hypothetical protein MELLADRAFT_84720 [Melampsora larici-populina 98AG31]
MATAPTLAYANTMSAQPPRTVQALVNEEAKAPPPVRLYPSQHRVSMTRYATSTDPRGYIPVFEYPLNGQYIMIDCETGMVHFTGIWKALGHTKADVVKLVESDPTIAPYLRKVRGGYLKIQGTWLPFDTARTLARRVAWQVRYDLIPLFGPEFPDTCLGPGEPGFGQLLLSAPKPRGRRGKKAAAAVPVDNRKNNPAGPEGHMGSSLAYAYPGGDPSAPRVPSHSQYRPQGLGPAPGYANPSQARYSPYNRPPSHGVTQLDPLPSLHPPSHSRSASMHQNHDIYGTYSHSSARSSIASNHGSGAASYNGYLNPPPPVGSSSGHITHANSLPSMRNTDQSSTPGNLFETYRGPDSFEALSNRWLGSDPNGCGTLPDSNLINNDTQGIRTTSGSPTLMPLRRDVVPSPMEQYNFSGTGDHINHGSPHQRNTYPSAERGASYPFDQSYEPGFPSNLLAEPEDIHRRSSSAPSYPPQTIYDPSYSTEGHCQPQNPHGERFEGYVNQQSGSPKSHSPYNPAGATPRSPSPSCASTSTHLAQRHSHRASQHTLGGFSNNGNGPSEDLNHFSVLTSPAHLDLGAPSTVNNCTEPLPQSESDWNSTRSSGAGISPGHAGQN